MAKMSRFGDWRPRVYAHPGTPDTLDTQSVAAAFHAAATIDNLPEWRPLVEAGYRVPDVDHVDKVPLDTLNVLVGFVADHLDHAIVQHIEGARVSAALGAPAWDPHTVASALTQFTRDAQCWLAAASRHGGPAIVLIGNATIADPTLPRPTHPHS